MPNPDAKPQGRRRRGPGGYEKRDANAKWIFGIIAFLLVSGLIMHFGIAGMMNVLKRTPPPTDQWTGARRVQGTISAPAFPRLQVSPPEDLKEFRAREDAELETYGWINKTGGVVRIPIERAMDLVLQRGLPARSGTNGSKLGPSSYELQLQRPFHREPEIKGKQ